ALSPVIAGVAATQAKELTTAAPVAEPLVQEKPMAQTPEPTEKLSEIPAVVEGAVTPVIEPVAEPRFEAVDQNQPILQTPEPAEKLSEIPAVVEGAVTPVIEPVAEPRFEAADQSDLGT